MAALQDYFSLLSLPRSFEVDAAALEQSYFALQREYHPDRFAKASAEERAIATQMSVRVNDAYQTLKSPLARAQYLLQLAGWLETKPDQATLVESMEMQEQLAEATHEAAMMALAKSAGTAQEKCLAGLSSAFAAPDYARAAQLALRLSYVSKLLENIRQKRFVIANPAA